MHERRRAEDGGQRRAHLVRQVVDEAVLGLLALAQLLVRAAQGRRALLDLRLQFVAVRGDLLVQADLIQADLEMGSQGLQEAHVLDAETTVRLRGVGQKVVF